MATAIGPARNRFEFVNNFHGAKFWRAGDAAAGEAGGERGEVGDILPQPAFDGGNEMLHLRKFFEFGQLRDRDGTVFANFSKIVSQQIGDHHQLG